MTDLAVSAPLAEASDLLAGITALRQTLAPTLTDAELELFALIAKRKGLDPFSGQIVAVKRNSNRGPRVSFQTGIDGHRSIAERTREYLGSDLPEFGPACGCGQPPAYHPEWATVTVHRLHPSGRVIDQPARAKWHEFVPSDAFMWGDKPEVMLGKCAEAQALRKAFPWVLGDLYIPEEMARDIGEADATAGPVLSARETVAAKAAALRGDPPLASEEDPSEATEAGGAGGKPPAFRADGEGELVEEARLDPVERPGTGARADPAPMTATEFATAVAALAGVSRARMRERAAALFGDKSAKDMTPEDWGRLYADLASEAPPGP